jgi:hypothetical protein
MDGFGGKKRPGPRPGNSAQNSAQELGPGTRPGNSARELGPGTRPRNSAQELGYPPGAGSSLNRHNPSTRASSAIAMASSSPNHWTSRLSPAAGARSESSQ